MPPGPLGRGISDAAGLAIAESHFAATYPYNTPPAATADSGTASLLRILLPG